jgi:diguanylate cyclase (GGDEF)-like protein
MFLDLDRFKQVNDTFGHAAGDDLLKQVAARLGKRLRDVDMLARLGGDEFVVVLDEISDRDASAAVAHDLIAQLDTPFTLAEGNVVSIGCSIGIALFPEQGDNAVQLLMHADDALYRSKENGRGICSFYTPS